MNFNWRALDVDGSSILRLVVLQRAVVDEKSCVPGENSSTLEVPCPRQELERKFEIVLLAKSAWMELKSGVNES